MFWGVCFLISSSKLVKSNFFTEGVEGLILRDYYLNNYYLLLYSAPFDLLLWGYTLRIFSCDLHVLISL